MNAATAYSNHTRSIGTLQADAFFVASERARQHEQTTIDVETTTTDITAGGSGLLARHPTSRTLAAERVDTTGGAQAPLYTRGENHGNGKMVHRGRLILAEFTQLVYRAIRR